MSQLLVLNAIDKIIWFGTSVSKSLNKKKFEKDTNTKVKVVKAYGIEGDSNQRYPEVNFNKVVTDTLEKEEPDAIILQTGSIEITNIDVKGALMDPLKSIDQYKAEWTLKAKKEFRRPL